MLKLNSKNRPVPSSILREFVVGDHICSHLISGKVADAYDRHALKTCTFGPLHATVAGDDLLVWADQDVVQKAEFLDAFGYLLNLLHGMRPRIPRSALQQRRVKILDSQIRWHAHLHERMPNIAPVRAIPF